MKGSNLHLLPWQVGSLPATREAKIFIRNHLKISLPRCLRSTVILAFTLNIINESGGKVRTGCLNQQLGIDIVSII